jgi:hypothetical protein
MTILWGFRLQWLSNIFRPWDWYDLEFNEHKTALWTGSSALERAVDVFQQRHMSQKGQS